MHCKGKKKAKSNTKSVKSYSMSKKKPVKSYSMSKKKKKPAPKGYHYMPNGKLMKDSDHKRKKK